LNPVHRIEHYCFMSTLIMYYSLPF
jgi:hypothetical protein